MKTFKCILFLLTFLSIVSCSVEKRHYMSGYNINLKNKQHTKTLRSKIIPNETSESVEYPITSSEDNTIYLPPKSATVKHLPDTCDLMELKDNSKVRVKIIEIRTSDIKYKICGSLSDSAQIINKSEVIGIDFSNGLKGEFDSLGKLKPKKEKIYRTKPNDKYRIADSAPYESKKIVVLPKGKYKQNDIWLHQLTFWEILLERDKLEIDKLVVQSKQQMKKQQLGFLIIPLSVFLLYFPLGALFILPITWTVYIACIVICALLILYIAIVAHRAKRKRWIIDREATNLYNESLLK